MFGSQIKMLKVNPVTNSISSSGATKECKTFLQKKGNNKDREIQVQKELIANKSRR